MTDVGKTATGTPHVNTVVLHRVIVAFQRFPGTLGTDADRGISGVAYTFKVNGAVAAKGNTAADGSVTLDVPAGSNAILEIFGTQYAVRVLGSIPAETAILGQQQRLQLLGYELGEVDGDPQVKTERAVLEFQADNAPIEPTGDVDATTQAKLKSQFGE